MDAIFDIDLDDVTSDRASCCNAEDQPTCSAAQGVWLRDVRQQHQQHHHYRTCSPSPASRHSYSGVASGAAAVAGSTGDPGSASLQLQVMRALADLPHPASTRQMAAALHRAGLDVRLVAALGPGGHHRGGPEGRGGEEQQEGGAPRGPRPLRGPPPRAPSPGESRWSLRDPYLLVLPRPPKPVAAVGRHWPVAQCPGGCGGAGQPADVVAAGGGAADDGRWGVKSAAQRTGASPLHRRHRSDLTAELGRAAADMAARGGGRTAAAAAAVAAAGAGAATAAAGADPAAAAAEPLLIEPGLRDLFRVGRSTPHYDQLVSRLPQVWVGPRAALLDVAATMCLVMEVNFRSQGLDVPPWRTQAAVLSRWDERLECELPLELHAVGPGGQAPGDDSACGLGAQLSGQPVRHSRVAVEQQRERGCGNVCSRSSAWGAAAAAPGCDGWSRRRREALTGEAPAGRPATCRAAAPGAPMGSSSSPSSSSYGTIYRSSVTFVTCGSSSTCSSSAGSGPAGHGQPNGSSTRVCGQQQQEVAVRVRRQPHATRGAASVQEGPWDLHDSSPGHNTVRRCSGSSGRSSSGSSSGCDNLSESAMGDDEEAVAEEEEEELLLLGTAGASPHSVLLLPSEGQGGRSRLLSPEARAGAGGGGGGRGRQGDGVAGTAAVKLSVSQAVSPWGRREQGSEYARPTGQLHGVQGHGCDAGTGIVEAGVRCGGGADSETRWRHSVARDPVVVYGFRVPAVPVPVTPDVVRG